jgi:hypothetical protein
MPQPYTTAALRQARAIVTDPGSADVNARILAWAALKSARGQTVRQLRLRALAHAPQRLAACGHRLPGGAA